MEIKRGRVVIAGFALALAAGCASHGGAGASTGGLQSGDGGVMLKPGEKCSMATMCSTTSTKSYQTCTVAGSVCSERFITSDNTAYPCNSCSDCQAAAMMVTSWCGGSATGTSGSGGNDSQCAALSTSTACGDCCASNHPSGNTFYSNLLASCECGSFGDCADACSDSLCLDGSFDSTCDQCVQQSQAFGDCDETTQCMANQDCGALLDCMGACPF